MEGGHLLPRWFSLRLHPLQHRLKVGIMLLMLSPIASIYGLQPSADDLQLLHRGASLLLCPQLSLAGLLPLAAATPLGSTGPPRECVGVGVSGSSPVFHSEDVGLEFLQPPGHLPFRLLEGHEPLESRVVGPHCKRQAAEVVPEVTDGEQTALHPSHIPKL